jgi:hypothetical protein
MEIAGWEWIQMKIAGSPLEAHVAEGTGTPTNSMYVKLEQETSRRYEDRSCRNRLTNLKSVIAQVMKHVKDSQFVRMIQNGYPFGSILATAQKLAASEGSWLVP